VKCLFHGMIAANGNVHEASLA